MATRRERDVRTREPKGRGELGDEADAMDLKVSLLGLEIQRSFGLSSSVCNRERERAR